jgi:hypothetical protein
MRRAASARTSSDDLRVVAHRRADQPDALGDALGDEGEEALDRHHAHAPVRRAPHHAVSCTPREQPRSVSIRNMPDSSASGARMGPSTRQESRRPSTCAIGRQRRAVAPRARTRAAAAASGVERGALASEATPEHATARRWIELVRLAHDDRVDEGRERERVRERQGAAREHERVAVIAIARAEAGDRPARSKQRGRARELQLVRDAQREHRAAPARERSRSRRRQGRDAHGIALVGQEEPLAGHVVRSPLDQPVDLLKAERATSPRGTATGNRARS